MVKNIVFYADDDVDDLNLLTDSFESYAKKIDLITAEDGRDALAKLMRLQKNRVNPCLIILDINMPYVSGIDILKELREMEFYKETPIILFSTSNSPQERKIAEEFNSVLITKPVNVVHLNSIAETFIEYCHDEVKKKLRRVE